MATFVNPQNGYKVKVTTIRPMLWCFLFGPFYFMYHRCWGHAITMALLSIVVIPWLVYPFFAPGVVKNHYRYLGWKQA